MGESFQDYSRIPDFQVGFIPECNILRRGLLLNLGWVIHEFRFLRLGLFLDSGF